MAGRGWQCIGSLFRQEYDRDQVVRWEPAWSVGDAELTAIFAPYGEVQSARVVNDRDTGRSRGFGFVEIDAVAADVIRATDGKEVDGRNLRVNEAEDKDRGGSRGGSGGSGGGYGGRRSRY
jgi:cold-inducible RNA-binding protein